jgi:hypothetical protein
MFLVDGRHGLRMGGAIMFRGQTENERRENENNHAFFLGGENKTLLELVEFPGRGKFQCADSSFTRGRTRTER